MRMMVCNPELEGKAIRLEGHDIDGDYINTICLVTEANGDTLTVLTVNGRKLTYRYPESFADSSVHGEEGHTYLKITVLEER